MKSILIVTCDFEPSGITTFMIALANYLSEKNQVTVAFQNDGIKRNNLNPKIMTKQFHAPSNIKLGLALLLSGKIKHYFILRNSRRRDISPIKSTQVINQIKAKLSSPITEKYDVVISAAEFYCNYYVAYKTCAQKKIGWIHPDYSKLNVDINIDQNAFDMLDHIVTISRSCCNSFLKIFPECRNKTRCIENLIDDKTILELSREPIDYMNEKCLKLVTVCRLDNTSKRLDRVVNAAALLKKREIDFVWYIVGGGEDEQFIQNLIIASGLQSNIIMVGNQNNPYPFIKKADVFVLSSQYEGKPIVITEALVLNCPVIVTNYLTAKEQVNSDSGVIIENSDEKFPEQLLDALQNKLKHIKKSINAFEGNNESKRQIDDLIDC